LSKRRVVVTGLGLLTPVGNNVEDSWKNIVAGKSGIAPITAFDASDFSARICGSVKDFDATEYIPAKDLKKMDTFIHFGIAAGIQALDDSGLEVTDENAERIGVAIGSGIGGLPAIEKNRDSYVAGGPRKISPFFVPSSLINMVSGNLSIMRGLKGPNISIVSACTTGAHNIGDAARMISYGDADVMVAGASEMATCALGVGGFAAARALSTRNDDPEAASRPWDRARRVRDGEEARC
jgi:3-oxoacyl-[acyl-carrier-protein] synthase II